MRIGVVGVGYVGLATGVGLAKAGHTVVCVERDKQKLRMLKERVSPIAEPGYPEEAAQAMQQGRLIFEQAPQALRGCQVIFLTVGTPTSQEGHPDLSMLIEAGKPASLAEPEALLVVKSTAPPGTARELARITGSRVASNPEFLREGKAIHDFLNPVRIVIGADSPEDEALLKQVYQGFEAPVISVDTPTAELSKYASNLFLALKVSYANWLTDIARALGADGSRVLEIAGMDPRIGGRYLKPGLGWGGSCLPKDLKAGLWFARENRVDAGLLEAVDAINRSRIDLVVSILQKHLGSLSGKVIAVLGLAFKAGTPDTRDSQSLNLIKALKTQGAEVRAHDPVAEVQGLSQFDDPLQALSGAHAAVIATDWPEFAELPPDQVVSVMSRPLIIDARGILDISSLEQAGATVIRLDRPFN